MPKRIYKFTLLKKCRLVNCSFLLIVLVSLATTSILYFGSYRAQASNKKSYNEYFSLSPTRTHSGKFIPAEKLGSSEYCGHCHTDIFQQWNASAHHFSSFNNPIYRKIALKTVKENNLDVLKFCASCHDPLPLLSGDMDKLDLTSWSANAGITCLVCHRMTDAHGPNGAYAVSEPILHPFALADNPILQTAHKTMLNLTPWLHTAALSKPFYSTSEYCASCHTLVVPKEINGLGDFTLLNEYGNWRSSHYANYDNKGHATEETKNCSDCHMPLVHSNDPAAKNGMIKSHNFLGGNTLLPTFHRDNEHLKATEAFLQQDKIKLELNGIRRNTEKQFTDIDTNPVKPGDMIELALRVINFGVGHNFPAGTVDSNEAWLEITVHDANSQILFRNGYLDQNSEISENSIKFGTIMVDRFGNVTDRRNSTTEAVTIKKQKLIKPGGSYQAHYSFNIPETARLPIYIQIKLNWRKYSPKFAQWVFEDRNIPELPITVIAELKTKL